MYLVIVISRRTIEVSMFLPAVYLSPDIIILLTFTRDVQSTLRDLLQSEPLLALRTFSFTAAHGHHTVL
jgi:hypothetical protein